MREKRDSRKVIVEEKASYTRKESMEGEKTKGKKIHILFALFIVTFG